VEENQNKSWLKILVIVILGFVMIFAAFYIAVTIALHQMLDPVYNSKRIEKLLKQQEKNFEQFEFELGEHPFLPKTRPMLVNLVKENDEYKIIVDLKPLEGNENDVSVKIKDNVISVHGELNNRTNNGEKILNFSQSYYLDEKLITDKMTKEKKGDKYIITIPFED
jgi:HSP20 family molecular chaperone IbpA